MVLDTHRILQLIRDSALVLPLVTERLSHGVPTFFIRERTSFLTVAMNGHHDLAFAQLVCAAPLGVQSFLVDERPNTFFVPPYVGGRGWIGVRLDLGIDDEEIVDLIEQAYRCVAPAKLLRELDGES